MISTLSNLTGELSLQKHGTQHIAHNKDLMCWTRFSHDYALTTWIYVLETVWGTVREIVKLSNQSFPFDHYYDYYYQTNYMSTTLIVLQHVMNASVGVATVAAEAETLVSVNLQQVGVAVWLSQPPVTTLFTLTDLHHKVFAGDCMKNETHHHHMTSSAKMWKQNLLTSFTTDCKKNNMHVQQ